MNPALGVFKGTGRLAAECLLIKLDRSLGGAASEVGNDRRLRLHDYFRGLSLRRPSLHGRAIFRLIDKSREDLDWHLHHVDSRVVRARRSAAGAKKEAATRRSRGGGGTKFPLRREGVGAVIPTKSNQKARPRFDKAAYRERSLVERCVGRLKEHRRIATPYEKLAKSDLAMLHLDAILRWI